MTTLKHILNKVTSAGKPKWIDLHDLCSEYLDEDITSLDLSLVYDSAIEMIEQEQVIYYGSAMEFLSENDSSLKDSLEIAQDCGLSPKQLNSEILATLLKQSYMTDELNEYWPTVEEVYNDYMSEAEEE